MPKAKREIINILGKSYRVEYKNNFDCNENMGVASRPYQRILINKDTGKEQQQDTLLHEVIHIIDKELSLGLAEESVGRLAVGLHSAGYRRKSR